MTKPGTPTRDPARNRSTVKDDVVSSGVAFGKLAGNCYQILALTYLSL